ncbi:MAG: hypothetical protein ISR65_15920 [Bacteriovoracaceae bacterium]|nr:hypothetical protein [Bacteriovoracaceae bacterium]
MRRLLFTILMTALVTNIAYGRQDRFHCYTVGLLDKQEVGSKRYFCSRAHINQHELRQKVVSLDKNWNLVINIENPKIEVSFVSYGDIFSETSMKLPAVGSSFTIDARGHRLHCLKDKNICGSQKAYNNMGIQKQFPASMTVLPYETLDKVVMQPTHKLDKLRQEIVRAVSKQMAQKGDSRYQDDQ